MNNIANAKTLIAMLICMAALIGPSAALNPASMTIRADTGCTFYGDMSDFGRLVDIDADYWLTRSDRGTIELLGEGGTFVFYVDENLAFMKPVSLYFHDTLGALHTMGLNVYPCAPECTCEPNDPGNNIVIGTPTVGYEVPVNWLPPGGNGNWDLGLYEDGVLNRGAWTGLYPIEVIAKELDEDDIPTGFEISDCICG